MDEIRQDQGPRSEPAPIRPPGDDVAFGMLFGKLALQVGFVDQKTLEVALDRRRFEPDRPLTDILVKRGSISDEDRRVIDLLCDRHLANHGGNPQQSLASFSFGGTVSYR